MKPVPHAAVVLALSFAPAGSARAQDDPALVSVLERAQAYVEEYEQELGMIIGEEEYVQDATWMTPTLPPTVAERQRRRLSSDFLLLPVRERWYGIRSVLRVDGRPVPEPETLPESPDEIIANRTDTAYNIGSFERTFNVPTFALTLLRLDNISRFSFEKRGEDRIEGYDTWEIRFAEEASPTLVRGSNGEDRYASGRFWIDPGTGKILRTEIVFEVDSQTSPFRATMRVQYEENVLLELLVPNLMEEHYTSEFHTVDTRADYSNFKRFSVRVDQNPGAVVQ